MRRECCETCARPVPERAGVWWCNALCRHVYDYEMDGYPPCGCARWMPNDDEGEDAHEMSVEYDRGSDSHIRSGRVRVDDVRNHHRRFEMSGFYRFPAMEKLSEYTDIQQCDYICGEVNEASKACADIFGLFHRAHDFSEWSEYEEEVCEARDAYGMELMDVIHAAETVLRMEFSETEVEMLRDAVERKNREMGYYGAAAGEGGAGCTAPA